MTNKLVYCSWGAGIALGIYGTRKEVQRTCNDLFNCSATDSEPLWLNEKEDEAFAYVLTTWERLVKGFTTLFIKGRLRSKKTKARGFKKGFINPPAITAIALNKANNKVSSIISEPFLGNRRDIPRVFGLAGGGQLGELTES